MYDKSRSELISSQKPVFKGHYVLQEAGELEM
jgi:hypothetical protein